MPEATETCSRRRVLLSAAALSARAVARGQQDTPTFSTEIKVVNVLTTVRNRNGEILRDLSRDDFSLAENGRPQQIRYFSRQSDLPLTLGLLVDTSMSQRRVLNAERGASLRFLDGVLRENTDQVFLMQFDMAVQMRQALTSSRRKLDEALAFVDTPTLRELRDQTGGGTLLYDALAEASVDVMRNQRGRKALILLTDGVDTGSETTMESAIEAAQRADTLVYSILFSDPGAYGFHLGGADGKRALTRISKETGGSFLEVSKKQSIGQIFDLIQEELRSQYNLGYVSDVPVRVSEFRRIQVTLHQKGLFVQARDRYWAQR
jgi:VWFA-related protein